MKVVKEAQGGQSVEVTEGDLALINRLSRRELKAEEVYTFAVRLCDNEVDRDHERFPEQTLKGLQELFVGKSGIFDHNWTAAGQSARIYRTEVVHEMGRTTKAGDGYCYLKGYAYMVRTGKNEDLIAEIEGGIKKEVSVGCAVERSVCSICGCDMGQCVHEKGHEYDGALCWASLEGAKDAYEFSFVAVPAQPEAGVIKGKGHEYRKLAEVVRDHPACREELQRLEKEAKAGRSYMAKLRGDVVRLGALAESGMDVGVLRGIAGKLEEEELLELKRTFERAAEKKFALKPQLEYKQAEQGRCEQDGAFII